jgi:large exoprotein involved in heme utilization and adhesion
VLDDSRVVANARRGAGGNITLSARRFIASPTTLISASSELGIDGQVTIDAPEIDLAGGLADVAAAFLDPASLLLDACSSRYSRGRSSLVEAPRGGVPETPSGLLRIPYVAAETARTKAPAAFAPALCAQG